MSTVQGKCIDCQVRWVWRGKPLVRDAICPVCTSPLDRTSGYVRLPVHAAYTVKDFTTKRNHLTCDSTLASLLRRAAKKRALDLWKSIKECRHG